MLNYDVSDYRPQTYSRLENAIDSCIELRSNLLIITLPGLGATHLLQHYLALHPDSQIHYINSPGQSISNTYNFLDTRFDQIESYFLQADYQQKFAVVINQPQQLQSTLYTESNLPRKFSKIFYLEAYDQFDTKTFIDFINPHLSDNQKEKIYSLSGGIPRLTKFLCTNPENISLNPSVIAANPIVINILSPTISAINKSDKNTLETLGITQSGKILSPIISLTTTGSPKSISIKINFDLTFVEENQINPLPLNKIESQILDYMMLNNNSITREKIAEIKWGSNSYDSFSDLAITKTMRRLRHKLAVYSIKTVPKTGYILV